MSVQACLFAPKVAAYLRVHAVQACAGVSAHLGAYVPLCSKRMVAQKREYTCACVSLCMCHQSRLYEWMCMTQIRVYRVSTCKCETQRRSLQNLRSCQRKGTGKAETERPGEASKLLLLRPADPREPPLGRGTLPEAES